MINRLWKKKGSVYIDYIGYLNVILGTENSSTHFKIL
jgi:hypothetical protein